MRELVHKFGNANIFRPSLAAEHAIRDAAKKHLLSQFAPGIYTGLPANLVLQCLYGFYEEHLNHFVPDIASRSAAEFLLFQYDEATKILHGRGISNREEMVRWIEIEGVFRRAIKYIVELICVRGPSENPTSSKADSFKLMEGVLICAEAMSHLSEMSERMHSVFPNEFKVTILSSDRTNIFEVEMTGSHQGFDRRIFDRLKRDRVSRANFVGMPQFDVNSETHANYLDSAFKESHGGMYRQFVGLLHKLIDEAKPAKGGFSTLFIHRQKTVEALHGSGLSEATLSVMLDGFTVDPRKMTEEVRRMWNPKQENRALWRGFFLFPHPSGPHLVFSREMARENLIQLVNRVCYKRLPLEWITPPISRALGELSQAAGKGFEDTVNRNLHEVNIIGGNFRRKIGRKPFEIAIPDEVGEIDFLGFEPQSRFLVVVESKMTFTGLEGRFWRDDLDGFVHRERSYARQFRKKIAWVQKERARIQQALGYRDVAGVAAAMITLYPCIAQEFISDFPCVSLTEFRLDFQERQKWPYSQGVVQ